MTDLVEFLRARLDEDAVEAESDEVLAHEQATGWLPERVLREVEAKRRIVDEFQVISANLLSDARFILRIMATVYVDHPDYDEAWRP